MGERARVPRRGSGARWIIVGLVIAFVAWLLVSGVVIWSAHQRVDDGLDALERARTAIDRGGLGGDSAQRELRAAKDAFAAAHSLAGGLVLSPWRFLPLTGENVRSVESLTSKGEHIASVGEVASGKAREVLRQHPSTGSERIALLDALGGVTRRAGRSLQTVDLGPDFFLVGPLGDSRDHFGERFDNLRTSLADAAAAMEGVERLLRGPRRYLVVAASSAEMRGGSGMMLSAGIATFENGEFSLGEMRPTSDLDLPAGAVALPDDLRRLWGWAPVGRDWRWLATTPRFDVTGAVAADMWEAATGQRVDGVLVVDQIVVQSLLEVQGPVDTGGRRLSAGDVLDFLLLGQYTFADASDPEQAGRGDQLGPVARRAIDTLSSRSWEPDQLARRLIEAGRGRHLLAWARDPAEEHVWKDGGIGGELHGDSLALSILNTGGNRLDPFLDVHARLQVTSRRDGGHDATVQLRFENAAPTELPPYVSGPHRATDLAAGEYQGVVAVNTPGVGSNPELEGLTTVLVADRDGPTRVVGAGPLRLAPGEAASVMVRFTLPEQLEQIVVEPSARVPAIVWSYRGERWRDTRARTVVLG